MRFLVAVVLVGCGTDHHHGVAADAAVDAPDYIFDAPCRAQSADYHGVFEDAVAQIVSGGAMLVVRGDPTRHTTTTATGSFVLCAPYAPFIVDIDAPDDQLDGHLMVEAYDPDSPVEIVPFTTARLTTVLSGLGQTYDPSTGIVIAERHVDDGDMDLSGTHGAAATNETGWTPGTHGRTVMFPNVPPGTPMLSRFGDGFEVTTDVFAGQITWVDVPVVQL